MSWAWAGGLAVLVGLSPFTHQAPISHLYYRRLPAPPSLPHHLSNCPGWGPDMTVAGSMGDH